MKYDYDCIVIGGGSAGLVAAKFAVGIGKKTLLIERNKLGGECTWTGCVPSKTIIASAQVAYQAQHLKTYGLKSNSEIQLDSSGIMDHIRSVIKEIYATHTPEVLADLGIEVQFGSPVFQDEHTITLENKIITAHRFIVATGTRPFVPPIDGLEQTPFQTNETIFNLERLPQRLTIVGGGAIGVELATACNRLGVRVTIVERNERILHKEDVELVALLTEKMEKEGITILTKTTVKRARQESSAKIITLTDTHGSSRELASDELLIAVGRQPNIEDLGLETVGVKTSKKAILVDDMLRTSVKTIYAAGDVVGPYLFSHMAFAQSVVAARNALLPFWQKMRYNGIIWATFSDPELATTGLSEEVARAEYGSKIRVYTRMFDTLDRAHNDRELAGMAKVICTKNGHILGAHILGAQAAEIIHQFHYARMFGKKLEDLYHIIHAYPTYAEIAWHMSKKRYVEALNDRFLVRFARWLFR